MRQWPNGLRCDHDLAGFRKALQAGREIGRVADHFGRVTDPLPDDGKAARDADSDAERSRPLRQQPADRCSDRECRADRAFGIVLMRSRPAEIGENPVADDIGDIAVEAGDLRRHRAMIARQDVPVVLGVELCGKPGRTDEIDERDRQMTPFRGRAGLWLQRARTLHLRLAWLLPVSRRPNRADQPSSVTESDDAEIAEILVGQGLEHRPVDRGRGERLCMVLKAEIPEQGVDRRVGRPVRCLRHRCGRMHGNRLGLLVEQAGKLELAGDLELAVDRVDMRPDGRRRDEQQIRNFPVAAPLGIEPGDLSLALTELAFFGH
jgi:hypothetical protein